jgi:hypothetical protein
MENRKEKKIDSGLLKPFCNVVYRDTIIHHGEGVCYNTVGDSV